MVIEIVLEWRGEKNSDSGSCRRVEEIYGGRGRGKMLGGRIVCMKGKVAVERVIILSIASFPFRFVSCV